MTTSATTHRPPKLARVALPILFAISAGCLVASLVLSPPKRRSQQSEPVDAAPPPTVPAFSFAERNGTTVTDADLRGKVWVASFVFTQCDTSCPQVTATMHRLQADLGLKDQPDLRLVTFTMDPDHDTPAVLKRYADDPTRPADPDRWLFLTGSEDAIRGVMRNAFKLAFERNPNPETPGKKYNHGTFLFAVDKKGQIRGHFDGWQGPGDPTGERFRESYARLLSTVRELLAE